MGPKHTLGQVRTKAGSIAAIISSGVMALAFSVAPVMASGAVPVYDATPNPLPPNVASLGYEATSTSEFGDYIHLGGTNRKLDTVTVTMSDWALYSDYANDPRYSGDAVNWTHPITVNVYGNQLGSDGAPDNLLATKTVTITIPWRPVADTSCANPTQWEASNGQCYSGKAFNAVFDLSDLKVTLPNDVIVGIAYNTADYGLTPLRQAGPYNSLNVGVPTNQTATVGTDDNTDNVFWNTSNAGFYTKSGTTGVFREDTGWSPYGTVAIKITASAPQSIDQCKNGGWTTSTNPTFKNQGDCVSYFASNGKAKGNPFTNLLSHLF